MVLAWSFYTEKEDLPLSTKGYDQLPLHQRVHLTSCKWAAAQKAGAWRGAESIE